MKKHRNSPIEEEDFQRAFSLWRPQYNRLQAEQKSESQLKTARISQLLSTTSVAKKLNVSQPTYYKFEKSELDKKITLETMEKVAEALECNFTYELRPKNHPDFASVVWEKYLPKALKDNWLKCCDPTKKTIALVSIMKRLTLPGERN